MMFFKRRHIQTPKEIAWDDKTVEWIAQSDQLDVHVTHILKTISLGRMQDTLDEDRLEWSVHGVMTFPKFIRVEITFERQSRSRIPKGEEEQFGGFFYDLRDYLNAPKI